MNNHRTAQLSVPLLASIALSIAAIPASVLGGTRFVSNSGVDSGTCGQSRDHACRSINQAIDNASTGDVIWVGAGQYGPLSGNDGCAVCITKGVQIYSYSGTTATVIEAGPDFGAAVQVLSDKVVFGAKNHGFTVTGGRTGVLVDYDSIPGHITSGITVAGNVTIDEGTGFQVQGPKYSTGNSIGACLDAGFPLQDCDSLGQVSFVQNTAVGGGAGFMARVNWDTRSRMLIKDNRAIGTGVGFDAAPGNQESCSCSLGRTAELVQLVHNVATHNGVGLKAVFLSSIQGNVASGNSQAGFVLVPMFGTTFKGNAATGNKGPGAIVLFEENNPTYSFATFTQNDFYGNDRDRPGTVFSPGILGFPALLDQLELPIGPAAHCGVLNLGAVAEIEGTLPLPTVQLSAVGNYWGSEGGPAPTGPGDAVGGTCDQNGGVTVARPFSSAWFSFAPLPD